jgi:hypothetical protein
MSFAFARGSLLIPGYYALGRQAGFTLISGSNPFSSAVVKSSDLGIMLSEYAEKQSSPAKFGLDCDERSAFQIGSRRVCL